MLIRRLTSALVLLALLASACGDDDADTTTVDTAEPSVADTAEDSPQDDSLAEDPEPESGSATDDAAEPDPPATSTAEPDPPATSTAVEAERIARVFADTVADGDAETASLFASQSVLAFFAPWEPDPGAAFQSITDDVFVIIVGPGHLVACRLDADLDVAACADEDEPEVPDDEVIDFAYDDPAGYYLVEYLTPELGGFPETREGAIVRTLDAYVVDYRNCCTDDTLYASVTSVEDNAVFTIYGPDGEPVAVETMSATVTLQQGGEYWIVVGSTRGNAPYTIDIGLAQDAS